MAGRGTVYLWIIVVYLVIFYTYFFVTKFEKTITVREEILFGEPRGALNLVQDKKTNDLYKVHNNVLLLHFNASELVAMIETNGVYKIKGYGVRVPALGLYPCILDARLVSME